MRIEYRNRPVKLELKAPHILFIHDWSMRLTFYAFPLDSFMAKLAMNPVKTYSGIEIQPELKGFLNTKDALSYRIPYNSACKIHIVGVYSNT